MSKLTPAQHGCKGTGPVWGDISFWLQQSSVLDGSLTVFLKLLLEQMALKQLRDGIVNMTHGTSLPLIH